MAALEAAGAVQPFPIQSMALPLALDGQDVIGQARTGTGKTYAFGVAMLQHLRVPSDGRPQGLVVTPTRELTLQVADDIGTAGARTDVRVLTVYGGRPYEPQIEGLRAGVEIVVGTPGRLLDLSQRGDLDLSGISVLVLDEADRMLDLGFLPDVERILQLTPDERQTMLFSATMPGEVVALSRNYLRRATHVRAEVGGESQMVPSTSQHVFRTHPLDKPEVVARVLQAKERGRTMIFCRTKRDVDRLTAELGERGFAPVSVHGDLGQGQRERAMRSFRNAKSDILVATDVAARGLDVDDVTHVVNYACPDDDKDYLHRIGRTGRAGRAGTAVTFVDWEDMTRWRGINDALDLDFPEPPETYSTSEHLYSELGIPPEAGGRLTAAHGRHGQRQQRTRRPGNSESRHPRTRTRRRTRAGKPVDGRADAPAGASGGDGTAEPHQAGTDTSDTAATGPSDTQAGDAARSPAEGQPRARRRRRRRGSSGRGGRAGVRRGGGGTETGSGA